MPLGRTWRDLLEDPATDLKALVRYASDWDYCAVGERAEALGEELGAYGLMYEVDGLRWLGYSFANAIAFGDREEALRLLDLIERKTPMPTRVA